MLVSGTVSLCYHVKDRKNSYPTKSYFSRHWTPLANTLSEPLKRSQHLIRRLLGQLWGQRSGQYELLYDMHLTRLCYCCLSASDLNDDLDRIIALLAYRLIVVTTKVCLLFGVARQKRTQYRKPSVGSMQLVGVTS